MIEENKQSEAAARRNRQNPKRDKNTDWEETGRQTVVERKDRHEHRGDRER
jgi:hypothetical protein